MCCLNNLQPSQQPSYYLDYRCRRHIVNILPLLIFFSKLKKKIENKYLTKVSKNNGSIFFSEITMKFCVRDDFICICPLHIQTINCGFYSFSDKLYSTLKNIYRFEDLTCKLYLKLHNFVFSFTI